MATVLLTALLAELARGHTAAFNSQVTISYAKGTLVRGQVVSGKAPCKRHREVQVYRVDPGGNTRLGTVYSVPNGDWKLKGVALANGQKLFALIETKVLRQSAAHDHTCTLDRSPSVIVPYP
jgi:hypothetical protein